MNINQLKKLLAGKSAEYNGLPDQAAADLANQDRTKRTVTQSASIIYVTAKLGPDIARRLLASMQTAAESDALIAHTLSILEGGGTINLGDSTTQLILDSLTVLDLTAGDATAIKALADELQSDAKEYNLPTVKVGHISKARA